MSRTTNHRNLNETLPAPETLPISMLRLTSVSHGDCYERECASNLHKCSSSNYLD